jgi:DNA-binding MarR family transcriptional regulator
MNHYDPKTYLARSSIGYLLRRSASLMRDQLDVGFQGQGFSLVQWVTLIILRDHPTLTPGELGRELHHDSGALTRVLDQLEARGLLRRQRSDQDRRVVQLELTTAGLELVESLTPMVVGRLNEVLREFSAAEVDTLSSLLGRLVTSFERAASVPLGSAK